MVVYYYYKEVTLAMFLNKHVKNMANSPHSAIFIVFLSIFFSKKSMSKEDKRSNKVFFLEKHKYFIRFGEV